MHEADRALCLSTLTSFRAAWENKEGFDDHGRGGGPGGRPAASDVYQGKGSHQAIVGKSHPQGGRPAQHTVTEYKGSKTIVTEHASNADAHAYAAKATQVVQPKISKEASMNALDAATATDKAGAASNAANQSMKAEDHAAASAAHEKAAAAHLTVVTSKGARAVAERHAAKAALHKEVAAFHAKVAGDLGHG